MSEEIQNRTIGLQVAKGSSTAFIGMLGGRGLKFLLALFLGRFLGASLYGIYELALSVLVLSGSLSMLGLQSGVVKFVANYHELRKEALVKGTLISSLSIPFLTSLLIAVLIFLCSHWIASEIFHVPQLENVLRMLAFGIPFYSLTMMTSFAARGFKAIGYEIIIKSFGLPLITGISVGIAFFLGSRLQGAIYGTLIGYVFSSLIGLYLVFKLFPNILSGVSAIFETRKLLRFSLPLSVIFITVGLSAEFNRIIVGAFGSMADVGIYSAAARIGTQLSIILLAINTIVGPMVSAAFAKRDFQTIEALYKLTARWALIFTIPATCLIIFWSQPLLSMFGREFQSGTGILVILCLSRLVGSANGSNGIILQMTERQDLDMINNLIALFINIVVAVILVRPLGALGAAIGIAGATVIVNIIKTIQIYILMRTHPFSKGYFKPCIAGVVALLGLLISFHFFADNTLHGHVIATTIFLVLYLSSLWLAGLEYIDRTVLEVAYERLGHNGIKRLFSK